ncbi:MAG TPA: OsmC family protein [Aeromicrobium sp.]|nr:OsmC family protein [Aeromicrobium sp.]
MDAAGLRALQAPLKERYREDPGSAATPLTANAAWSEPGITCTVDGFAGAVRAGLHPATGGDGSDACSAEMLLEAVLACLGVTLRSVATAMGVELSDVQMTAHSAFDARGTLGIDRQAAVGIGPVDVTIAAATEASDESIDRLLATTERYCVVGQSLKSDLRLAFRRV